MIIDQLPALQTAGNNDEIAIEVGTTTYKIKKSDFLKEFMPKSGGEFTGNVTFNGVMDVTPRRCYATLSSAGWYRVFNVTGGLGRAGSSFSITLHIGRAYNSTNNELHTVTLIANYDNQEFSFEVSKSNTLGITKVRYTGDGSNDGYIDIYYNLTDENFVYVDFDVHCRPENAYLTQCNAVTPTAVATSPSGETVLAEYTFVANTDGLVTDLFSTSKGTVRAYRSGDMVTVTFAGNSTTWTEDEVFMTVADGAKPALAYIDVVSSIGRQAVVTRIYQNGNIVLWTGPTVTGNQRLYFSTTYPILH